MELIFTPEAYGAATDGISDDTRAVQSAMDAAAGAGGRCLLAGGIYLLVQPDRPSSGNYWPDWSRASCADLRNIQGLTLRGVNFTTLRHDGRPVIITENCTTGSEEII